jgi:hypothetical protein
MCSAELLSAAAGELDCACNNYTMGVRMPAVLLKLEAQQQQTAVKAEIAIPIVDQHTLQLLINSSTTCGSVKNQPYPSHPLTDTRRLEKGNCCAHRAAARLSACRTGSTAAAVVQHG